MGWERTTETDGLVEWERSDGYATVRLRRRPDGAWAVRVDRLYQAPEGQHYRRESAPDRDAAAALAAEWRREFDVSG